MSGRKLSLELDNSLTGVYGDYRRVKMLTLAKVIAFAVEKHGDQRDKGGNTYIRHPLRVMEKMDCEDEMVVAVLHDVLEDTTATVDDLKALGCTEMQIMAIQALTKFKGQSKEEYLSKVMQSTVARKVKIADIEDNMDIRRLKNRHHLEQKDFERFAAYARAWTTLTGK